jgi:hypothetical protein
LVYGDGCIGNVDCPAIEPDPSQGVVENMAGGTDEPPAGAVILIAGLFVGICQPSRRMTWSGG